MPHFQSDKISELPISTVLEEIKQHLASADELVIEAPPGAGKTTVVPLALLDSDWLRGKKILLLEPRRIAARAAAERMAELLGEKVGATVGYRVRLDSCVSDKTRIEVITEGILTRQLQHDPALENVALLIFDEFHERNLDTDLGLALSLQGRSLFREADAALKIVVMSATLDGDAVSQLLGDAAIVRSQGRQYPVSIDYVKSSSAKPDVIAQSCACIRHALDHTQGNILVFLPGQAEIKRLAAALSDDKLPQDDAVMVYPLYGGLTLEQQRLAIAPTPANKRKIVLATNIAETSLTIEGIATVIDSGLVREPRFDPRNGMTRMTTTRISRASSEQRAGRAGRLSAGHCYRLWSEEQQQQLAKQAAAEILQADLAPLVLALVQWGITDPEELDWLDTPPRGAYQQALDLLQRLQIIQKAAGEQWQLTIHGHAVAALPTHPRLAHMLVSARELNCETLACHLAAILSERDPFSTTADSAVSQSDLRYRLGVISGDIVCEHRHRPWRQRVLAQSRQFQKLCHLTATAHNSAPSNTQTLDDNEASALLLALAYPDRIAQLRKQKQRDYLLSNGRSACLPDGDSLANNDYLAIAELGGQQGQASDRIYSALPLDEKLFTSHLQALCESVDIAEWQAREEKFVAERQTRMGAIILKRSPLAEVSPEAKISALRELFEKRGLQLLPWNEQLRQWRARVSLLHEVDDTEAWPDMSDAALADRIDNWLLPYLGSINKLQDFAQLELASLLHNQLSWAQQQKLNELAPERIEVPSGSTIRIDYLQSPPVLAVKLQEMFGCERSPQIVYGKVSLLIHLLSPAQRPLQVTQDLAGFWRNSYQEVKKEMKGRYPKHPWPDDPLQAVATRFTKRKAKDQ